MSVPTPVRSKHSVQTSASGGPLPTAISQSSGELSTVDMTGVVATSTDADHVPTTAASATAQPHKASAAAAASIAEPDRATTSAVSHDVPASVSASAVNGDVKKELSAGSHDATDGAQPARRGKVMMILCVCVVVHFDQN